MKSRIFRNFKFDCFEAWKAATKWFRNLWFNYVECYGLVRVGDAFIVKMKLCWSAVNIGDIVVVSEVIDRPSGRWIMFVGDKIAGGIHCLHKSYFKKVS